MHVLVTTDMRARRAVTRFASEVGATGIHIGGRCLVGEVTAIAAEALGAGLAAPSMTLPLGDRVPAAGKRLPRLGAAASDERQAALALASEGLAAGAAVGITRAALDFGAVELPVRRADLLRHFERREMDEDEPGGRLLAAALGARRAGATSLLDACRWSLERLARVAERHGTTLLLAAAGTPWGVPSPREAAELMEAFAGAPLAPLWDPGQLSVLRALDLPLSEERARALADGAGGAIENDAVGMEAGYLPGLGERDGALPGRATLAPGAAVTITGHADVTEDEAREAVARVTALYA